MRRVWSVVGGQTAVLNLKVSSTAVQLLIPVGVDCSQDPEAQLQSLPLPLESEVGLQTQNCSTTRSLCRCKNSVRITG